MLTGYFPIAGMKIVPFCGKAPDFYNPVLLTFGFQVFLVLCRNSTGLTPWVLRKTWEK